MSWTRVVPALILLSACASPPVNRAPPLDRQLFFQKAVDWTAEGRLFLQQNGQASQWGFSWRHDAQGDEVVLHDLLGRAALTLQQHDGGVSLRLLDGQEAQADNGAALVERLTGLRFPVDLLDHWLRALPEPGIEAQVVHDPAGRMTALQQAQWSIQYPQYMQIDGIEMPARITVEGPQQIALKILIKHWSIAPQSTHDSR